MYGTELRLFGDYASGIAMVGTNLTSLAMACFGPSTEAKLQALRPSMEDKVPGSTRPSMNPSTFRAEQMRNVLCKRRLFLSIWT